MTEQQSKELYNYFEHIMFELYEYAHIRKYPILDQNGLGFKVIPDVLKILNAENIKLCKSYNRILNGICIELPLLKIEFKGVITVNYNDWTRVELIPKK